MDERPQQQLKFAGELKGFKDNLPHLLAWASFLIQSDCIEMAEHFLFNALPPFYKDNPPKEVIQMRRDMYKFLMNVSDYAMNREDNTLCLPEQAMNVVKYVQRGKLLLESVTKYNADGIVPHIFDMGPGDYWLPIGLKALGRAFTYQASYLSQSAYDKQTESFKDLIVPRRTDQPVIFVANEIIEHLRSPFDIVHCCYKNDLDPDQIHVSTPLNTFSEGCDGQWNSESNRGRGGHLRGYSQGEFIHTVQRMFPGYSWNIYPSEVQSIIGVKKG